MLVTPNGQKGKIRLSDYLEGKLDEC
ncbi:hypothetical protein MTBLM1_10493 [Rhodospirillaceae bacterium LM-1]|nr:hypothetical protein MTBLM1_10493 [Rhodospirillaceae bacterium LM-1]